MNSNEREQLIMDAESKNIIQCPYCNATQLLAGYYGWAGDESRGYTVRCKCRKMVPGYSSSPSEAVIFWNELMKKYNPMEEIKELAELLSDDNKRELLTYLSSK